LCPKEAAQRAENLRKLMNPDSKPELPPKEVERAENLRELMTDSKPELPPKEVERAENLKEFMKEYRKKAAESLKCTLPETCGFLGWRCWFSKKCTDEELEKEMQKQSETAEPATQLYSLPQPQYCLL
jgi:hypothetical protein